MVQNFIASVTVGAGGSSSIQFSSIPGTFTDLTLVVSGRYTAGFERETLNLRFNGDTGSNYTSVVLEGTDTTASSRTVASNPSFWGYAPGNAATASTFGNTQYTIPNYIGSAQKAISIDSVTELNGAFNRVALIAGVWTNTSAITSITLFNASALNFAQHSTAYLYGTLKGSGGATVS
jgi:hypothetical protein